MQLKKIGAAAIALTLLSTAKAQTAEQFQRDFAAVKVSNEYKSLIATPVVLSVNEDKYRKFKKLRTGGIVATAVGAGLVGLGAGLISSYENDKTFDEAGDVLFDERLLGGAISLSVGVVAIGGGITMWVIGNNKMKKYGAGQISVQPTKNGLGLAYKF